VPYKPIAYRLGVCLICRCDVVSTSFEALASNKLLIYKAILKPIWTYGIQLWGTASTSNIEILERFQSKALSMIVDAPWYVPNTVIRRDLQIQQLQEKFAATALNTVLASAHTQMA
jgi:hypothetical protein